MVFAARLTQQGHKIASMDDLMELYEKSFSVQTVAAMGALPHPTIQKFAVITVAIVGASRRFLAQITRHQKGARIGQLVITPTVIADFVTDLGTERGTGSFGSTGE